MSSRPSVKTEQFDMDSLFDFSQGTSQQSPINANSSTNDALSPFGREERPQFNGPSHDYGQFKQQVGVPLANVSSMPQANMTNGMFEGFSSGYGDMDFSSGYGFNSGLDFDADMNMDLAAPQSAAPLFFPNAGDAQTDFINPNTLAGQEEPQSNVGRLWPGMHSQKAQQAALAKAQQAQAVQQRQIKIQAQQAQLRQSSNTSQSQSSQGSAQTKRASYAVEPHVEESISRLLNQMRQNGGSSEDGDSSNGLLPHIARMKKDEEDMDEDERLLASEEGKKLSSKERRQLRNKVSARAFRSRRKEYITQLEGEVALRTQENNALRAENQSVMQENERYRGLIETLLRHPAFTPFINDISNDPSLLGVPQQHLKQHQQQQQRPQAQAQPSQPQQPAGPVSQPQQQAPQQSSQPPVSQQEMKPEYMNFDASQLQIPTPQPGDQAQRVNMATLPDTDFSKLNINGFNGAPVNFNNYSVGAYVVTDVPSGPSPIDLLLDSPARLPPCITDNDSHTSAVSMVDSDMTLLLAKLDNAARTLVSRTQEATGRWL